MTSFISRPFSWANRDVFVLAALSAVIQALYLYLPLNLECDARMYNGYARFLSGGPIDLWIYYRPPGYGAFLVATGQATYETFTFTIAAQALGGILCPLLVYWTLVPVGRRLAFWTAVVLAASTIPFTYAKLMLPEQLYSVLLLAMLCAVARYYFRRNPIALCAALLAGGAALLTRYDGIGPLALTFVTLALCACRRWRHLIAFGLTGVVVATVVLGWSWERSRLLESPALFGSLHNFSGRQLFWRFYTSLNGDGLHWARTLGGSDSAHLTADSSGNVYVEPGNGPATSRVWDILRESVRNREFESEQAALAPVRPDLYAELFGRYGSDTEALLNNIILSPNQWYNDWLQGVVVGKLGIAQGDELLGAAARESVQLHPILLLVLASNASDYFGIDFWQLVEFAQLNDPVHHSPIYATWLTDDYERLPFNVSGCTDGYPARLRAEYAADHQRTLPAVADALMRGGTFLHNSIRDTVGPLFLLLLLLLPLARYPLLGVFATTLTLGVTASAVVGLNYSVKFEHVIFPIMLISTALGGATAYAVLRGLRLGAGPPPPPPVREVASLSRADTMSLSGPFKGVS